jgi:hypothetical protein
VKRSVPVRQTSVPPAQRAVGGWSRLDQAGSRSLSTYSAQRGNYVVFNIDYRKLDNSTVYLNDIIEDVFGAILWVKDNAAGRFTFKPVYLGSRTKVSASDAAVNACASSSGVMTIPADMTLVSLRDYKTRLIVLAPPVNTAAHYAARNDRRVPRRSSTYLTALGAEATPLSLNSNRANSRRLRRQLWNSWAVSGDT